MFFGGVRGFCALHFSKKSVIYSQERSCASPKKAQPRAVQKGTAVRQKRHSRAPRKKAQSRAVQKGTAVCLAKKRHYRVPILSVRVRLSRACDISLHFFFEYPSRKAYTTQKRRCFVLSLSFCVGRLCGKVSLLCQPLLEFLPVFLRRKEYTVPLLPCECGDLFSHFCFIVLSPGQTECSGFTFGECIPTKRGKPKNTGRSLFISKKKVIFSRIFRYFSF